MKKFSLVGLLLIIVLLVSACGEATPTPAPAPAPTPAPSPAPAPAPAPEPKATSASIVKGGLMYDKWWKAAEGATEPTEDHALWALQDTNTRSGADTWRCKECHGWDYQGKDGAYSSGSHFTGFPNIYNNAKTKAELLAALTGGVNPEHDFSPVLSDAALGDLANFLNEGTVDNTQYIDYATKKTIGANLKNGEELFTSACVACHGANGKQIDFHDGEGVRGVALDNPQETLHKIRFGQPGTAMPSGVASGWSTQDAVDVLGYSQTLPE